METFFAALAAPDSPLQQNETSSFVRQKIRRSFAPALNFNYLFRNVQLRQNVVLILQSNELNKIIEVRP